MFSKKVRFPSYLVDASGSHWSSMKTYIPRYKVFFSPMSRFWDFGFHRCPMVVHWWSIGGIALDHRWPPGVGRVQVGTSVKASLSNKRAPRTQFSRCIYHCWCQKLCLSFGKNSTLLELQLQKFFVLPPSYVPKMFRSGKTKLLCGDQRLLIPKIFENATATVSWLPSFLCSYSKLFTTGLRVDWSSWFVPVLLVCFKGGVKLFQRCNVQIVSNKHSKPIWLWSLIYWNDANSNWIKLLSVKTSLWWHTSMRNPESERMNYIFTD